MEAFCSVGTPAESKGKEAEGTVVIGSNNRINEYATIHAAVDGEEATVIGDGCYIMVKSHIGHDAIIESEATISCLAIIGGHSVIMRGANIGLAAVIHQNRVVGQYAMVGMNSTASRSLDPFLVHMGSPARGHRVNRVGLQRANLSEEFIESVETWFQQGVAGVATGKPVIGEVTTHIARYRERVLALGGK